MFGLIILMLGTVTGFVLTQYIIRGAILGHNFSIKDVFTNNIFSESWNQASPDARLQSLTTFIVAIPGLSIIKMFLENKKKK